MAKVNARGTFANENEEYECQNCGETWELSELNPIDRIFERVAAGEVMPAGECPACGALCHPRKQYYGLQRASHLSTIEKCLAIVDMNRNSPIKVRAAALDVIAQVLRGKA